MTQSVYRVHLIPYGGEHPEDKWGIFDLCIQNSLIGIGWAAPNSNLPSTTNFDAYEALCAKHGQSIDSSVITLRNMKKNDLAWVRDPDKIYYLAEIRGPWEYRNTPLHRSFDILNVRRSDIWAVDQAKVPLHVRNNAFPKAVQRIANEEAVSQTVNLWKQVQDTEVVRHVD